MARITSEDCLEKIRNPFDLINVAALRARMLLDGAPVLIDHPKHKPEKTTVLALREVAAGVIPAKTAPEFRSWAKILEEQNTAEAISLQETYADYQRERETAPKSRDSILFRDDPL